MARKAIPANDDRICARFCHEASAQQRVRLPGVDWVDVTARMESAPHEATMVQLPVTPAYALVLHKVQSLTMPEKVLGCLEGIFAHGQVYVLISRVTDPQNFCLIGLPPVDMLDVEWDIIETIEFGGGDISAHVAARAHTGHQPSWLRRLAQRAFRPLAKYHLGRCEWEGLVCKSSA